MLEVVCFFGDVCGEISNRGREIVPCVVLCFAGFRIIRLSNLAK